MADLRALLTPRPRPGATSLADVARGVLLLRLAAAALSVPSLTVASDAPVAAFAVRLGVLATSLVPLLQWERVQHHLMGHPMWLALDLVLALLFLSAAGVAAPSAVSGHARAIQRGAEAAAEETRQLMTRLRATEVGTSLRASLSELAGRAGRPRTVDGHGA